MLLQDQSVLIMNSIDDDDVYISLMLLQDQSVLIMNSIDDIYIIDAAAGSICFDHEFH
jgi:hypothetical protein